MLTSNSANQTSFNTLGSQSTRDMSSEDWMRKGESAFSAGNLNEAKQCFEKALVWAPFDAKLHNNLSVIHWKQGETEEALHSLTRALELDPDDQDVILNCTQVFQALGKKQDAREILEAYLARKPWDLEVRRAMESIDQAPEKALARTEPMDSAGLFNDEGEKQFEKGRLDHARACFEMAIEHNPDHSRAHSNLGVVCWQQGELPKAMEYLYRALDLDSEDPDILFNCSKVLTAAGELATAASLLKFYLRKNPADDAAWEDYDSIVRQMGEPAWQPEGLHSDVADVYLGMGKKLAKVKDYYGAAESFRRSLILNPGQTEVFYLLGQMHLELGQKTEALEIMREALKPGEFHKKTVLAMGDILISLGHREDARSLYRDYLNDYKDKDVQGALNKLS